MKRNGKLFLKLNIFLIINIELISNYNWKLRENKTHTHIGYN